MTNKYQIGIKILILHFNQIECQNEICLDVKVYGEQTRFLPFAGANFPCHIIDHDSMEFLNLTMLPVNAPVVVNIGPTCINPR